MGNPARLGWAGLWVGFGFGGFFDGIVLHQVLQWHHLLSGMPSAWMRELRHQVMADGLFHAVMYLIAGTGLVMVMRQRAAFAAADGPRRFTAAWLVGFGVWHAVDAVLSHWLLGLHRIRMDTQAPLAWDLGWLAAFGLVPLAAGLWLRRRADPTAPPRSGAVLPFVLIAGTLTAGSVAGLPPPDGARRAVVLAEGADTGAVFRALARSDARVVAGDRSGRVWWVTGAGLADAIALYRHGAVYVGGTLVPAGCGAWQRGAP